MKREDYLSWDEYFMGIALLAAKRSKDPGTQVGACIVSPDNKILTMGYNGMPTGCHDDNMPWEREGDPLETKYLYVCHAEFNAILNNGGRSLKGATLYATLFPVMNVPKRLFSRESKRLFTWKINMRIRTLSLPPKECLIWLGSPMKLMRLSIKKLSLSCKAEISCRILPAAYFLFFNDNAQKF